MSKPRFRDRFVAFAFAAADLLIETDDEGTILFAVGASSGAMGMSADELEGLKFENLVCNDDRSLARAMLRRSGARVRVGPLNLRSFFNGSSMAASLLRSGDSDRTHIALTRSPSIAAIPSVLSAGLKVDAQSAIPSRKAFQALVRGHVVHGNIGDLAVSLVNVLCLNGKSAAYNPKFGELTNDVWGALRCLSIDGAAVTQLAPGRFAVLNETSSSASVQGELRKAIAEHGCALSTEIDHHVIALGDSTFSVDEMIQALDQVFDEFGTVSSGGKPVVSPAVSIAAALKQKLALAHEQIDAAHKIIQRRRFTIVFQPIVDLQTLEPTHFEALARFDSEKSPLEFVTFAEDFGLIVDFDLAVVETVLHRLNKLMRNSRRPKVAVNLSARSLQSDRFVERIGLLFASHYESARQLLFEITETSQIVDLERANRIIQRWRANGFQVCIDDFGAGAAAFHYIRCLTVDFIKLDGGYIGHHLFSERDASILRSMISLSQSLKVATIAEMIEDEAQLSSLRSLGVDYGQGFLLGQPSADLDPPFQGSSRPTLRAMPDHVAAVV